MAEALVNVLLERLASITLDKAGRELKLVKGVDKEITDLNRNLEAIRGVLEDAEQRQVKEARVRRWLNDLEEVSYEMDDVLDEWNTEILKLQIEKGDKDGENVDLGANKKVCFPIPSACFCFGKVNRVIHRRDIALKIKNLSEKLSAINDERQSYNFQYIERCGEQLERQKTSSLVDDNPFGREDEKNTLVSKLVSASSQEERGPLIIPIVGMGGIGKTTLSQLAYNDEKVKAHFDLRIWVCVSDPFDEIKIAKAIVEDLNKNNAPDSKELQTFVRHIYESIEGKKFLLVLDDVWNPKRSQWDQIMKPLRNGGIGGRILVTTRNEDVVKMMGATTHMIRLKELSEEYCRSLFYHIAFNGGERNKSKIFEAVGDDIVKKCKGLPLAAKTLGSLMGRKKTVREWQSVLNSEIWELKEFEQEVFQPLLLSYYDLPSTIRRCLLYCVIFPKDFKIDKDNLIELWMSQDYLNFEGNKKEKEMIGQTYFDDLVIRCFFQDFEKDGVGNIRRCKMHDIVHDFVQYLTKNEFFSMEIKGANERIYLPNDKIRHLTLMFVPEVPFSISINTYKSLRTLTTFDSKVTTIRPELILQLKFVRTLNLRDNRVKEIPEEISKLIHLRYLDLSMNDELEELPDAIGELYNLQTLRIDWCGGLKKVPDMGRLINLRHLHVEGTRGANIKGIGRLRNLQTVDEFHVGAVNEGGLKLEDLKNLDHLQGSLSIIHTGRTEDASQAEKAQLVNKKDLLHLKLYFGCLCGPTEEHKNDGEILNALQPHPGLESLEIWRCYNTTSSPNWLMSLQNLRKLHFHIPDCTFLPPLGKLSSLESLKISECRKIGKIGVEFLGLIDDKQTSSSSSSQSQTLFPKLEQLEFNEMFNWEEWEGVEGWREEEDSHDQITIMPSLSTLTFQDCSKLETLPNFLRKTPLEYLEIYGRPILERCCEEEGAKEWDKISHTTYICQADDYDTEEGDDCETEEEDDYES